MQIEFTLKYFFKSFLNSKEFTMTLSETFKKNLNKIFFKKLFDQPNGAEFDLEIIFIENNLQIKIA